MHISSLSYMKKYKSCFPFIIIMVCINPLTCNPLCIMQQTFFSVKWISSFKTFLSVKCRWLFCSGELIILVIFIKDKESRGLFSFSKKFIRWTCLISL